MEIKQFFSLRFLILNLLCFYSFETLAQDTGDPEQIPPPATVIIDNQDDGNGLPSSILIGCNEVIYATIYTTNLVQNQDGVYSLPNSATSIFIKIIFDNVSYFVPVESFNLSDDFPELEDDIFYSVVELPNPFQDMCTDAQGEGTLDDYTLLVPFHLYLADENGAPYPYALNDDPESGIFSCNVFCNDCGNSDSDTESCISPGYYGSDFLVECSECLFETPGDEEEHNNEQGFVSQSDNMDSQSKINDLDVIENSYSSSMNISTNANLLEFVHVTPNPFNEELVIKFPNHNSQDIEVNIYNSKGEKLSQNIKIEKSSHKIILDSNSWEQGLYIIQIKTSTELKAYKMVKVK